MIYKGIVESLQGTQVVVRIPSLDKTKSSVGSVKSGLLGSACICTLPGISVQLQRGDVVFVEFEDTINEKPVILGTLYGFNSTSKCNMSPNELTVNVRSRLPKDTYIGEITYDNLSKLLGLTENIQSKFNEIDRTIKKQTEKIKLLTEQNKQLQEKIDTMSNTTTN